MNKEIKLPPLSVPDGWKLVPVEPTDEMLEVGMEEKSVENWRRAQQIYHDMLAAAPTPPASGQALQSQHREDAERRQIADLVLHHAEGMQVSSPLESRQGFGEDTEHYFQISDGKIRYGVIITITRLTGIDHARRIEGEGE